MSLVMVMGMTLTATAAEAGAKIKVVGDEGADLTYAQVIKADPTKATGWAFTDSSYSTLFAAYGNDEQSMIQGWIDASEDEQARLDNLGSVSTTAEFTPNPMTITEPGLYVIKGADKEGAEITYKYSTMLAFVSYEDIEKGETITVKVKRTPETVKKELVNEDSDKYVEVGSEITYQVKATVPYKPAGGEAALVVKDEITGGKFKLNNGKVDVSVKLANETTARAMSVTPADATHIEIDLADLITDDNENANVDIVVSYVAIADGTVPAVNNKASINNNGTPSTVTSYTGKVQITKRDSKTETALSGAEFVIVKGSEYAILKKVNGVDTLDSWTTNIDEATKLTTGNDGTATAGGFDKDVTYSFHEVTAPEGYSLNPTDAEATWEGDEENAIAKAEMLDTTLSQLPYTGGKGTAAFTGLGVLLMSVAAGLYFANKKNKSMK